MSYNAAREALIEAYMARIALANDRSIALRRMRVAQKIGDPAEVDRQTAILRDLDDNQLRDACHLEDERRRVYFKAREKRLGIHIEEQTK